jgi:addiction module RelB/DinJ family antitoxin
MPTIQVRTDDQTKDASTALFNKLGITMSEAINLFLRQAIMRGGIPFALTLPETRKTNIETAENEALVDAMKRYRSVNGKGDFDITKTEPLFRAMKNLGTVNENMRITFQEKAVKVRLNHKGMDYVIDYNFDEPDNVFILTRKDGKLFVKDCNLAGISETLGSF